MTVRVRALVISASIAALALATVPAIAQTVSAAIKAAVADPGRPEADTKRDAERKPAEVIAFAGVRPGMKVAELFPAGGYYTRILSKVVGPKGRVYLITPLKFQDRMQKGTDALTAALPNAFAIWEPGDAPATPEPVDLYWTTDNYHDYRNPGFGGVDMAKFDKTVFDSLKPGGLFMVNDHAAAEGVGASATNTLHRIEEATVKQEAEAAGFKLVKESKILANPQDNHLLKIFDPSIRGHTDQFILLFRKPK